MTDAPTTETYEYARYTPTKQGDLSETTAEQDRELADRILDDPIFSAELNRHARENLASDNPDMVYKGLTTVFAMEYKISCLGGWSEFIEDKYKASGPAEPDPLANDTHLSGVSRPQHVPGYRETQAALEHASLAQRKAELYDMDIPWPSKIKRGLRPASTIREAEIAVRKAEQFLSEHNKEQAELELVAETLKTHPLAFIQLRAMALVAEIIEITLTTPMPDRAHLYQMCHDVANSWEEKELLELWIMEADLLVHPVEEVPVLPPVTPAASTQFAHEFDPARDAHSRTVGIDRTNGGNRKPKPDGKKKGRGRK